MNDISKSFANLVNYNNGFFKSEKQSAFLLSQTDCNVYTSCGNVYCNSFTIDYYCDKDGVVKVEQHNFKTGKIVLKWERKIKGKQTIQDKKTIAQLKRRIKKYEKSIKSREESIQKYIDKNMMDLYNSSMDYDKNALNNHLSKLKEYEN
ncbi:MAG: hypothetical protein BV456_08955 [Thermoplasmata archaeon M8B2D]|nr:MAG: hypothetical protein BV456_08955 [Thermoplasmata archaeon M8B2D]